MEEPGVLGKLGGEGVRTQDALWWQGGSEGGGKQPVLSPRLHRTYVLRIQVPEEPSVGLC